MNLHENKELFLDAILAASQAKADGGLGVKQVFIEKDSPPARCELSADTVR